jgi:hypothetical protein
MLSHAWVGSFSSSAKRPFLDPFIISRLSLARDRWLALGHLRIGTTSAVVFFDGFAQ